MSTVVYTDELDMLIIRAQAGDLDAFGTIVQRFQDMAVGYAYSILGDFHLAQDAAQEAFVEAYRNLAKVYGAVVFPAWLRRIVFKYCDRFTRREQPQMLQLDQVVQIPSEDRDPLEMVEDGEMKQTVLSAIRSLPEEERMVTTLFYIDGYSYKEIATFLEVPATTVDNRLRSSRKRLKKSVIAEAKSAFHAEEPSKDESFTNKVQLFSAAEAKNMDKVKELLNTDAAHAALYDFLKVRAEEQGTNVEELIVWLVEQYKEQVELDEDRTRIFREKLESQEKQEALSKIEKFRNEAKFHQGAILEIARMVPKAKHNIHVIVHAAYLASKFGYHTVPLIQIAQLASLCDYECVELYDIADLIVLKLSNTLGLVSLAESVVKAQTAKDKERIKEKERIGQEIEKFSTTADYGSLEEALEAQEQRSP